MGIGCETSGRGTERNNEDNRVLQSCCKSGGRVSFVSILFPYCVFAYCVGKSLVLYGRNDLTGNFFPFFFEWRLSFVSQSNHSFYSSLVCIIALKKESVVLDGRRK